MHWIRRLRTKSPYIVSYQSKWGKGKCCLLFKSLSYNFYFWHNRLHTRNKFSCPEYWKSLKVAFHFLPRVPKRNFCRWLILPTGSDLSAIPPTCRYLCGSVSAPPARPSLSFCQGVDFDTCLLTYSMVQSPSWTADWLADSLEISRISRNLKVHYRTHKRTPPVPILGQPNSVHMPTSTSWRSILI